MLLYVTLVLCATGAAVIVYRYDLYDREPWYMLVLMACAGAVVMWLLADTEAWTLIYVLDNTGLTAIAAVAATHEEGARLALVALLALLAPKFFNDPIDGLIYGSVVGLGMAGAESLMRLESLPTRPSVLPAAEAVRFLGHLILGGITGYGVGPARIRHPLWVPILLSCVLAAVLWHFAWDWIAYDAAFRGAVVTWHTYASMLLMVSGLALYGGLVTKGSARSRKRFDPTSRKRVWNRTPDK